MTNPFLTPISRRKALAAGAAGALIGAASGHRAKAQGSVHVHGPGYENQVIGQVDYSRNGFDPHAMLTDFDYGEIVTDANGQRIREWTILAVDKEIEIAPGVFFPAWTYNGRVPGPTLRAIEGERLR